MNVFRYTFRTPDRRGGRTGHALVVAPDLDDAEPRLKRLLDKYGALHPEFNAQYAWDTRKVLGVPLDAPFGVLLHDGVT